MLSQSTLKEHVMTSKVAALSALLTNARELSAAQARDLLPASWGPLPFQLELVPSPAQPLSAGGRLRDAGLKSKKQRRHGSASVNRQKDGTVDKFTTETEGGQRCKR